MPCIESLRTKVAEFAPTWIVAVGGGSVIDAAKFLWAQYEHPNLVLSGKAPAAIPPLRGKSRFAAVPTTAGSGSEASQAAVLTADDGAKIPYVSPEWVPDLVILDPTLTVSLPRQLTVATGFDALAHAVESAVSPLGNSLLQALATTSIELILKHLPAAMENPQDLAAREGMLEAAYLAGLCQSTASTGAAHALSHATSKLHGVPHAAATAFYLLPTMRWNHTKNLDTIAGLATRVGLPQTFTELLGRTLDPAERQALAEAAAKDICLRTNPCRMTVKDLAQLLAEIA
jgi:alcohol dehydrogenase class IV